MTTTDIKIEQWPVAEIVPSPFQRRKLFEEGAMVNLTESIRKKGVEVPLIGRLVDGQRELVAGERRWRASTRAGLATVPVIVRDLTDTEAAEIVLIENLQREDLTPMEEAESFQAMLDLRQDGSAVWTQKSLADHLSIPLTRIRRGLSLLEVPESLRSAVQEGKVGVSTAALVAMVGDPEKRESLARDILDPDTQPVPLSRVQTQRLIAERYLVSVKKGCGFDPGDERLVPVEVDAAGNRMRGGACGDCPFRSGNSPDLAEQLSEAIQGKGGRKAGLDPHLCSQPLCFRVKLEAQWKRRLTEAREAGLPVLPDKESKRIFSGFNGQVAYDSQYADLDREPSWTDLNSSENQPWRKLLKPVEGAVIYLARHPETGKAVELVNRKDAAKLIKAHRASQGGGKDDKLAAANEAKEKAQKKKEKEADRVNHETARLGMETLADLVAGIGLTMEVGKQVFGLALNEAGADGLWWMAKWLEIPKPKGASNWDLAKPIAAHVEDKAIHPNVYLAFALVALLSRSVKASGRKCSDFAKVCKALGVDLDKAEEKVRDKTGKPAKAKKGKGKGAAVESDGGLQKLVMNLETSIEGMRGENGYHVLDDAQDFDEITLFHDKGIKSGAQLFLAETARGWASGFKAWTPGFTSIKEAAYIKKETDQWFENRAAALSIGLSDLRAFFNVALSSKPGDAVLIRIVDALEVARLTLQRTAQLDSGAESGEPRPAKKKAPKAKTAKAKAVTTKAKQAQKKA